MSDSWKQCSKEFLLEFITLYKMQECLWKIKSGDYTDRFKRKKAYEVLGTKLQEVFRDVDVKFVCKKIDALRGVFRREMKKVKESQMSSSSADHIYIPKLWYYKHLEFLYDQETPSKFPNTLNEDDSKGTTSLPEEKEDDFYVYRSVNVQGRRAKIKKKVSKNDDTCDRILQKIEKSLENEDEFEVIGKNFANKLRSLPRVTRIQTEKIINDVLYYAELGTININTSFSLLQHQPVMKERIASEKTTEPNIKEL